MKLFVGPLPEFISPQDVRNFIGAGIRPKGLLALFKKPRGALTCTMMEVPNQQGPGCTCFAIMQIPFPALAERAIKNLNGAAIGGTRVTVRKYVDRDSTKDRHRGSDRKQPATRTSGAGGHQSLPSKGKGGRRSRDAAISVVEAVGSLDCVKPVARNKR